MFQLDMKMNNKYSATNIFLNKRDNYCYSDRCKSSRLLRMVGKRLYR